MTISVGTSANRRNQVLHHFNPPSLDSKLISKGKLGKNTKCSKGIKGCRLKYKQTEATMDYSFFALQFPLFQCIQGVPYISLQKGNGGSNPSVLKAFGNPRVRIFRIIWGKIQKYLDLCTHPNVRGFEINFRVCTRVWDKNSCTTINNHFKGWTRKHIRYNISPWGLKSL